MGVEVELETKLQNYIFSPKEEGSKQARLMLAGSTAGNDGWRILLIIMEKACRL